MLASLTTPMPFYTTLQAGLLCLVSKGWLLGFFQPQPTTHSLRPARLHLPLSLQILPGPPLALQIIKILQLQPEFRIRLEIPPGAAQNSSGHFLAACITASIQTSFFSIR